MVSIEKKQWLEVNEDVTAIANEGLIRRSDIIILNRKNNSGLILDSTFWFENYELQPKLVSEEKQKYIMKQWIVYDLKNSKN